MSNVEGAVLNVAAVESRAGLGGWSVVVGGVELPVWYPDRETAAGVAGRLFEILEAGHAGQWERYVEAIASQPGPAWEDVTPMGGLG